MFRFRSYMWCAIRKITLCLITTIIAWAHFWATLKGHGMNSFTSTWKATVSMLNTSSSHAWTLILFLPDIYPHFFTINSICFFFVCFCFSVVYGSWFDHVLPYWKFCQEHPDRMLFISFEELKLASILT